MRLQLELYRSGYFEALINVDGLLWNRRGEVFPKNQNEESGPIMNNCAIIEYLLNFLRQVKQISQHIGYEGQYAIFVDLVNILNYGLWEYPDTSGRILRGLERWNEDDLRIGPITYNYIDENYIAKDIGNRLWQSFGYEKEPFFHPTEKVFKISNEII